MSELKEYVDILFKKYRKWPAVLELKEEILGNLEDKAAHLKSLGWDEQAAIKEAKNSITNIDAFIDGNVPVYMGEFRFQAYQRAFLHIVIAWIATIPLTIIRVGTGLHFFLFFICLAMGIGYIFFAKKRNEQAASLINIRTMLKMEKVLWMLWGLFMFVAWGYTAALQFGSNIWFSRAITINGPYQFGVMVSHFALPFISIIVPLTFRSWAKLAFSSEVRPEDE